MKPSHMWEISTHPHSLNLLIKEMWTKFDCLHFDPDRFSLEDACSSVSDENNTQNLQRTEWDFDAPPFSKLTDSHPVANTCNYKLLAVSEENDTRNLQRTKWDFDAPPFSKLTDTPIPLPALLGSLLIFLQLTWNSTNAYRQRNSGTSDWWTRPPFLCMYLTELFQSSLSYHQIHVHVEEELYHQEDGKPPPFLHTYHVFWVRLILVTRMCGTYVCWHRVVICWDGVFVTTNNIFLSNF